MITMKQMTIAVALFLILGVSPYLYSHCQVPCGIFDDPARITLIAEHITTIEKAMTQIETLSKETPVNYNQIIRWVTNKEKHAEELSDIVTYYFMAQRIKPVEKSETALYTVYQEQLELLHHLLVYTMKAKQSTDTKIIVKLRELLKAFEKSYLKKE